VLRAGIDDALTTPTVLLVLLAVAFAWSMGAHYTGACMGMPRALHAIGPWKALFLMAPLVVLGAALASHGVERTVAERITVRPLPTAAEIVVLAVAFSLTAAYNRLRLPTSTIQILVFSLVGTAIGDADGVHWRTVALLVVVWALAPIVAAALGYVSTRALDRLPALTAKVTRRKGKVTAWLLVAVGAGASFAMGANDVSNASGALVSSHRFSFLAAGLVGGVGLALGVVTWGRPLLDRIAFEIVKLDGSMAVAAQGVQALVVLLAVAFGFFTSMNQALVGAMAGAGAARGRETVDRRVVVAIARGWLLGPAAGIGAGWAVTRLVALAGVRM